MMRSRKQRKQRNNTPGTATDRAVVGTHASSSYEIRDDIELNDRGSAYGSYNGRRRETLISTLSFQAKVSAVLKRHALFLISIAGAVHLLFMWRSNVSIGHAQQDSHQNVLPVVAPPHRYVLLSDRINLPHDLPPIYWINLDTSTDRREAMMDMLSSQGIVDAHRVSGVTTDEARHLLQTGHLVIQPDRYSLHETDQLARVAACTLSHLNAIKSAYEAHHEFAFIFEDDAILSKLFQDEWRGYADLAPPGWKILQFATNNLSVAKQGALALTDPFITWHVYSWCTRAYLINRAGMKTLMDKVHSSVAGQDFWHIEEEMIAADEVIYAVTGDTYTSTGLWIDDLNMKTTVQIDDQDPDVMNSYLPSIVGHPESQIEMKTAGNVFEESLLVLTSVTVGDEEDITKSIEWIIQDSTVCQFHHKCEWNIGFVATNSELMNMIREVYAKLNLPSNIHFHVSINPIPSSKFIFIQNFVEQIMAFDLVLLKDVDMRIIGFPWRTFVERKKNTNAVIIGPLREISLTRQRSEEYEPHWFGLHEALRWPYWGWSSTLFDKVMPIEVPYLEQYFVLMDAKFANFFFNIALRPSLVHHSSDWGVDLAWCAAAKSWDSSRPGCHLIPVVTFQDDDVHTTQRSLAPDDEGFEAIATYNTDPMLGPWIMASSQWRDIIGGKNLDEIQHVCRVLFGLDAGDSFDLQACATRADGGGMLQTGQGEFLEHDTLAVLVSGAGSSEVNGCYLLKGRNGNAWEFELINSITGRTFEMFKVNEESGWWNIQERVTDNSGSNPPHYGVEGDNDAILPPVDGWVSVEYSDSWLGMDPMPIVQLTSSSRTACKQQEANKSLLVLMNIKIQDKENIAKEIEWIREDYSSVCKFYSTCQWMLNVVTTETALMKAFEEVASNLPSNISISTSVLIGRFNKYLFIKRFVDQMMDYDLVLIKDNDQRLTSFSWSTFIEKRSNAVISGPLRSSSRNGEKRQWFQFHEASNWSDWGWSTYMFDNAIPIELPFLEEYFVLMDTKFANFFFNLALRPKLLNKRSDWGIDLAWCAAAKSWDSSRPGCHLIPVVSYHEDTRQINQDEKYGNEGFEVIRTYNADPILGPWIMASSQWGDIVGGKNLDEIQHGCRVLLGLDTDDSFDLQACATRAGGGVTAGTDDGYLTLTLIMNEINKRATRQSDEDVQMLTKAKNSLMERLGVSFHLQE